MHYVGYCIKSFVAVSAVSFPDILLYIMHPFSNKYIQEIIAGKFYSVICIYNTKDGCSAPVISFAIFFFLVSSIPNSVR